MGSYHSGSSVLEPVRPCALVGVKWDGLHPSIDVRPLPFHCSFFGCMRTGYHQICSTGCDTSSR